MLKVGGKAVSAELLGLIALLAFVLISTATALSPSHYRDAAYLQGRSDVHPIFGGTRTARSDEWGVATPYFQIAVASGLGERDVVSPYHEPLKAFFALPSRDWSMAFKPDLWGFLLLDPARAFARDAQRTWSLPQPVIKLAKSPRVVWPLPPGATPPPTD
jgi:hypothetical protein